MPAYAQEKPSMAHIVLLGDSIFDNAAYVAGGRMSFISSALCCRRARAQFTLEAVP